MSKRPHVRAPETRATAVEHAPRPIRVAYLDHVAQMSGGEIALLRLLPHLTAVEPHVILAEDGPLVSALRQAGVSTEVLPMADRARDVRKGAMTPRGIRVGAIFATITYIVRLASRLRRLRPDLVHTNSLKAGVYGSIAARLAGVPCVWHVRDRISVDYLPKPAVRSVRFMTRRLTSAVIANSHATMHTLDPQAQPVIVYSVVPEVVLAPAARADRSHAPLVVGLVGRLAPWKGQDLFLRAFADAFPDGDARCVLVGSAMFGEDAYARTLRDLAAQLGLADRAEFRGFQPDIWPELARMNILVHASVIPEPFGQVVLEGMAAQVPVVAAAAGGPAEIIDHDVNGVLYRMGDRAALANALRELAGDPERRRRLAEGGTASVGDYHPSVVAHRVEQLYRDVLANAATPSARAISH